MNKNKKQSVPVLAKNMIFNKKADADTMSTIKGMILVLVVLVVLIFIFWTYMKSSAGGIGTKIDCANHDLDEDGVKDIMDLCCTKAIKQSPDSVDSTGCTPGQPKSSNCCD